MKGMRVDPTGKMLATCGRLAGLGKAEICVYEEAERLACDFGLPQGSPRDEDRVAPIGGHHACDGTAWLASWLASAFAASSAPCSEARWRSSPNSWYSMDTWCTSPLPTPR